MAGDTESFYARHDTDTVIHALSIRLAKQCRELIQGAFREEEWYDIDREFYDHIFIVLAEFHANARPTTMLQLTHHN